MMSHDALLRILNAPATCSACGHANSGHAGRCLSCDAVLRIEEEEPSVSVLSGEAQEDCFADGTSKSKTPVEKARNYLAMRGAADGVLDGSLSLDQYRVTLQRVRQICDVGLKVFASGVLERKFADAPAEAIAAKDAMKSAFEQLRDGLDRMLAYTRSQDPEDVTQGAAAAEAGFHAISAAQDLAIAADL